MGLCQLSRTGCPDSKSFRGMHSSLMMCSSAISRKSRPRSYISFLSADEECVAASFIAQEQDPGESAERSSLLLLLCLRIRAHSTAGFLCPKD